MKIRQGKFSDPQNDPEDDEDDEEEKKKKTPWAKLMAAIGE